MKKLLFFLFLMLGFRSLQAQDLIVTQDGDSLNCKISKVAKDKIYFTFVHKDEVRKTLLMRSLIKQYQYNFYSTSALPEEYELTNAEVFPRLRVGISGGYSFRTASVQDGLDPAFEDYIEKLKKGYNLSADVAYYFSEQMGAGLRYSTYGASNKADNVSATLPDGTMVYGSMSDDITINFIGPYFSSRMLNTNKLNALIFNVGLGYLGYQDKAVLLTDKYTIKGSTLGFSADVGYDMRIAKKLSLGLQLSLVSGVLKEYELSNGLSTQTVKLNEESYENLARIDLSVGLRFTH
ncbi:hypothetical protein [Rufibacter latericius]|uniref:Outer membrane protein beta-barrel domain-containing protein n=1 Tax=Rufibacter latericius TaxID=2487040 RepID=A0A3M9MDL9_9BACT|nr:hypothetical protein [Rufibacter latericius]RNI23670.1 hypothetical protein EFB08_19285 [Rufibacter latericius]